MGRLQNNQQGFSAVEVLLVLIFLAIVGFAGYYIYHTQHAKTTSANAASATNFTAAAVNPYSGWKTYCDNYYNYCFKYPGSWSVESGTTTADSQGDSASFSVLSPSQSVGVDYTNLYSKDGGPATVYVDSIHNLSEAHQPLSTVGTYYVSSGYYYPDINVIDTSQIKTYSLTAGKTLPFIVTPRFTDQGVSSGDGNLVAEPQGNNAAVLTSASAAKAWFNSPDVKTAQLILESFYHN